MIVITSLEQRDGATVPKSTSQQNSAIPKRRAAFYIDGFNVYHAIASIGIPHLKWLDWWRLAHSIAFNRSESLVSVTFCTASPAFKDASVQRRHASYIQALQAQNVRVPSGGFIQEEKNCRKCGHVWKQPQEKAGDVNLAVSLIGDAHADVFDTAYLVTADNDQVPTLRHIKDVFGPSAEKHKEMVVVAPPNRVSSRALGALAGYQNTVLITRSMLESHLLPAVLTYQTKTGAQRTVRRPSEYNPPS